MHATLRIHDLDILQKSRTILENVNLSARPGDIIALVGQNGAGKTTFLKTLAGLLPMNKGEIWLDGKPFVHKPILQKAQTISFLLQETPIQPFCTGKNRIVHGLMPVRGLNFFPDDRAMEEILQISNSLHIQHLLDRKLSKMSGGEQRLVYLAKCLINDSAKLILLDEPTAFLDFKQRKNLQHTLCQKASLKKTIIFSSHNEDFIRGLATRIFKIEHKKALEVSFAEFIDKGLPQIFGNDESTSV